MQVVQDLGFSFYDYVVSFVGPLPPTDIWVYSLLTICLVIGIVLIIAILIGRCIK